MSARRQMTMRAHVQRDANRATEDPYGHPLPENWLTHLAALPCRMWFERERRVLDSDKTAAIEDRKMIAPKGTDILPGDRIADVRDRRGTVLFTGPARIEAVGTRKDHLELALAEVS